MLTIKKRTHNEANDKLACKFIYVAANGYKNHTHITRAHDVGVFI